MKNVNKDKLNFRKVYISKRYNKYYNCWEIYYDWDYKMPYYFRCPRNHRNKKLVSKFNLGNINTVVDDYDDIRLSRKYSSWKDRTKRKHQYKIIPDNNYQVITKGKRK